VNATKRKYIWIALAACTCVLLLLAGPYLFGLANHLLYPDVTERRPVSKSRSPNGRWVAVAGVEYIAVDR
jgi:hypothetical protein